MFGLFKKKIHVTYWYESHGLEWKRGKPKANQYFVLVDGKLSDLEITMIVGKHNTQRLGLEYHRLNRSGGYAIVSGGKVINHLKKKDKRDQSGMVVDEKGRIFFMYDNWKKLKVHN